jgi:hypothetical protein
VTEQKVRKMLGGNSMPRIILILLTSLACAAAQARAETMDELYEKAKLEKTITLYGAGPAGSHDRWIRDFQQNFPASPSPSPAA